MKISILLAAVLATTMPVPIVGRAIPAPNVDCSSLASGCAGEPYDTNVNAYSSRLDIERRTPIAMPMPPPKTPVKPGNGKPGNNGTPDRPGGVPKINPNSPEIPKNTNPGNTLTNFDKAVTAGSKDKSAWTASDKKILEEELTRIQLKDPSKRTPEEKALFDKQLADAKKLDPYKRDNFQQYIVAEDSGRSVLSRLDDVIKNDKPSQYSSVTWEEIVKKYTLGNKPETKTGKLDEIHPEQPGGELDELAKKSGLIDDKKKLGEMTFTRYTWRNNKDEPTPIQDGLYSQEANAQLGLIAFKSKDMLTPATGQLPLSVIRWNSWKQVAIANGKSPKDLKGFLMHNITGPNGEKVTDLILGPGGKKIVEVKPGDKHWNKIIGTDNVKGLVHMMADVAPELGKKRPKSVWVQRDEDMLTHMVLIIG